MDDTAMQAIKQTIDNAFNSLDTDKYSGEYKSQHQMLVIKDFLPPELVQQVFVPEVEKCTKFINRVKVPGFKKSGSVSYHLLQEHAPNLFELYKSDFTKNMISKIVGEEIQLCPENDPHAAALYYYTEPGDHIKVHYDKSFYKGKRFTVLLGMVQDSEHSQLLCYPGATKYTRKNNPIRIKTDPGTLVIFNGDTLWHEVSPLAEGEKRVILTMEFLTDTRISAVNKFISDFKDRYLYFGKAKQLETV